MSEQERITISIEPSEGLLNAETNAYLYSGPIEVWKVVNTINDLLELSIPEESPALKEPLIVFVNDKFDETKNDYPTQESLRYLGGYFYYNRNSNKWREILIGTHTHTNKIGLDKLSEIDFSQIPGGNALIQVTPKGDSYSFSLIENTNKIPVLPDEVLDQIKENKLLDSSLIIDPKSGHHLDAELSELGFEGDVSSPLHNSTAFGFCQDLYKKYYFESLQYNLYLEKDENKNLITSVETMNPKAQILKLLESREELGNSVISPSNGNYYIFSYKLENFNEDKDFVFLFINNDLISDLEYFYNHSEKNFFLNLKRSYFGIPENPIIDINILVIKSGNIHKSEIKEALDDSKISLEGIKKDLYSVFLKNQIKKKKEIPSLYLTNDKDGNLVWENNLVPSNICDWERKEITIVNDNEDQEVAFFNLYFDENSFPLILCNEEFVFDATYRVSKIHNPLDTSNPTSEDWAFIVTIPEKYFELVGEANSYTEMVTVIMINNGVSTTINKLAKDYITKEEAIILLSEGKIDLSKYATKDDFYKKADKYHVHSDYSKIDHTHDYRYSPYYHTHDENGKISISNNQEFEDLLSDAGFTKYKNKNWVISGENIITSNTKVVSTLNKWTEKTEEHYNIVETFQEIIDKLDNLKISDKDIILSSSILGDLKESLNFSAGSNLKAVLQGLVSNLTEEELLIEQNTIKRAECKCFVVNENNLGGDIDLLERNYLEYKADPINMFREVYLKFIFFNKNNEIIEIPQNLISVIGENDIPLSYFLIDGENYFKYNKDIDITIPGIVDLELDLFVSQSGFISEFSKSFVENDTISIEVKSPLVLYGYITPPSPGTTFELTSSIFENLNKLFESNTGKKNEYELKYINTSKIFLVVWKTGEGYLENPILEYEETVSVDWDFHSITLFNEYNYAYTDFRDEGGEPEVNNWINLILKEEEI